MTATQPKPRFFYGWVVLLGLFIIMMTGSGFAFYAQGVFLDALVEEQGFSVGMAGAGTGFFFVVSGIGGYYAGGLISRFDVRIVMTVGAIIAAAGMAAMSLIRSPWQMFIVFLVWGGGYAFAGLVPATSIVTRWFAKRRSVALSIASTGLSIGGIAITPVIANLVDRETLVDIAPRLAVAFLIGILPAAWFLVRPSPETMGLRPDGEPPSETGAAPATPPGMAFAEAIRTRYFKVMSAGFIMLMAAQVGAIQHLFKVTNDRLGLDTASLALVVIAFTSVCARIIGGVVAMRVKLSRLTTALIVVQMVGITIIGVGETRSTLLGGIIVLGASMGNLLMLHPLLLADAFGVRDYPRIYGLASLLMVVGVGLGPFITGLVRDLSDYRAGYLTMTAISVVGLVLFVVASADDEPMSKTSQPEPEATAVLVDSEATAQQAPAT